MGEGARQGGGEGGGEGGEPAGQQGWSYTSVGPDFKPADMLAPD